MATSCVLIAYVAFRCLKKSEDPLRIIWKWVITAILAGFCLYTAATSGLDDMGSAFIVPITAAVCGLIMGILWAPHLGAALSTLFTGLYDGGSVEPEARPYYSIAESKRKQGLYTESIALIREQLLRFPEDFQGWMTIAEIQAENLNDVFSAQETIERILRHPEHAPKNIAYALSRSADWHLKFSQDRAAAKMALERIGELLPNSEQSQLAAQRLAHLGTEEFILEKNQPRKITVTRHEENLGLLGKTIPPPPTENPEDIARQLVDHLREHPLDNEAREQLARIYVDHYGRLELALDQIEQLISVPHQQPKHVVGWLNLIADFHIKMEGNVPKARAALERIIEKYPRSAAASNAEKRIASLGREVKPKKTSQAIQLGSYPKNIGLNSGSAQP
ncbi:MAG: tetratricopeptide repeat protein [Verrucomicrobiota bacterium]|nr:tetratricopeptide repeat protein [Verrucomicrobiota bacterium]